MAFIRLHTHTQRFDIEFDWQWERATGRDEIKLLCNNIDEIDASLWLVASIRNFSINLLRVLMPLMSQTGCTKQFTQIRPSATSNQNQLHRKSATFFQSNMEVDFTRIIVASHLTPESGCDTMCTLWLNNFGINFRFNFYSNWIIHNPANQRSFTM